MVKRGAGYGLTHVQIRNILLDYKGECMNILYKEREVDVLGMAIIKQKNQRSGEIARFNFQTKAMDVIKRTD